MIRITIECEDYWVADSLHELGTEIENTDIIDNVYEKDRISIRDGEHFHARIEKIN